MGYLENFGAESLAPASDLRTALQAIRAAVDVLREARAYAELRGTLTGELRKDPTTVVNARESRILTLPSIQDPRQIEPES